MSEYQCYEFVALDRPLTSRQMAELRGISTRAEISSTRFRNEYQWGNLKADPAKLLERYFDAHLYFANWGTRRLMLRIPVTRVDQERLGAYFVGDAACVRVAGKHLIVDATSQNEEPDWDDEDNGQAMLAALAPLRAELIRGDLGAAYLAWLLVAQSGEINEKTVEPPVPAGLSQLTMPQEALVEFLRIDVDLVSAAAEGSEPPTDIRPALRTWVLGLTSRAKDDWLGRAVDDPDLALGAELVRTFRAQPKPARTAGRRTVAELLAGADRNRLLRERTDAERAANAEKATELARKRRLDALAERVDAAWAELEALVEKSAYDEAMTLAVDLRDLARRAYVTASFTASFEAMRTRLLRRRGFFDRWKRENGPKRR
jgi:hypothetical protein